MGLPLLAAAKKKRMKARPTLVLGDRRPPVVREVAKAVAVDRPLEAREVPGAAAMRRETREAQQAQEAELQQVPPMVAPKTFLSTINPRMSRSPMLVPR